VGLRYYGQRKLSKILIDVTAVKKNSRDDREGTAITLETGGGGENLGKKKVSVGVEVADKAAKKERGDSEQIRGRSGRDLSKKKKKKRYSIFQKEKV